MGPSVTSIAGDVSSAFSWTPQLPFTEQIDDIFIETMHLGVRLSSNIIGPTTNYVTLDKLIYMIFHFCIFQFIIIFPPKQPLEGLKGIIHLIPVIIIVMSTVQSFFYD